MKAKFVYLGVLAMVFAGALAFGGSAINYATMGYVNYVPNYMGYGPDDFLTGETDVHMETTEDATIFMLSASFYFDSTYISQQGDSISLAANSELEGYYGGNTDLEPLSEEEIPSGIEIRLVVNKKFTEIVYDTDSLYFMRMN